MGRDAGDGGRKFGGRVVESDDGFVEGDGVSDFDADSESFVGDFSDEEIGILNVVESDLHHFTSSVGWEVVFFDKAVGGDVEAGEGGFDGLYNRGEVVAVGKTEGNEGRLRHNFTHLRLS